MAAESLVGNAMGAGNRKQIKTAIRYTAQLGFTTALLVSLSFLVIGEAVIGVLTNVVEVREAAQIYLPWVIIAPLISVWCYLLDGVFIGATRTRDMRNAMVVSLITYMLSWWVLAGALGNHGLWASLMLYFITRAVTLNYYLPGLIRGR